VGQRCYAHIQPVQALAAEGGGHGSGQATSYYSGCMTISDAAGSV